MSRGLLRHPPSGEIRLLPNPIRSPQGSSDGLPPGRMHVLLPVLSLRHGPQRRLHLVDAFV